MISLRLCGQYNVDYAYLLLLTFLKNMFIKLVQLKVTNQIMSLLIFSLEHCAVEHILTQWVK